MAYRLEIPPHVVDLLAEVAAQESAAMTASSGELFTVELDEIALPIIERECLRLLGRPLTGKGADDDLPF
jgi:hypothetical protein